MSAFYALALCCYWCFSPSVVKCWWEIMFTRCIIYFFHNKEKEEGVCQYIQKRTIIEKKNEARMFMTKQVIWWPCFRMWIITYIYIYCTDGETLIPLSFRAVVLKLSQWCLLIFFTCTELFFLINLKCLVLSELMFIRALLCSLLWSLSVHLLVHLSTQDHLLRAYLHSP